MVTFKYSPSAVMAIEAALGRPANAHSWALTDTRTGTVKGIYASETLAAEAVARLGAGLFILTVLHPDRCDCAEVA